MADEVICLRIEFRGRVQGVGFRMTTAHIARRHSIGGAVRNCTDGSVEMIVAGTRAAVDSFLADVRHAMCGNIQDESVTSGPNDVPTDRFEITA